MADPYTLVDHILAYLEEKDDKGHFFFTCNFDTIIEKRCTYSSSCIDGPPPRQSQRNSYSGICIGPSISAKFDSLEEGLADFCEPRVTMDADITYTDKEEGSKTVTYDNLCETEKWTKLPRFLYIPISQHGRLDESKKSMEEFTYYPKGEDKPHTLKLHRCPARPNHDKRLAFPPTLDMAPFMWDEEPTPTSTTYDLILVHVYTRLKQKGLDNLRFASYCRSTPAQDSFTYIDCYGVPNPDCTFDEALLKDNDTYKPLALGYLRRDC